jgi:hypothetical protein
MSQPIQVDWVKSGLSFAGRGEVRTGPLAPERGSCMRGAGAHRGSRLSLYRLAQRRPKPPSKSSKVRATGLTFLARVSHRDPVDGVGPIRFAASAMGPIRRSGLRVGPHSVPLDVHGFPMGKLRGLS